MDDVLKSEIAIVVLDKEEGVLFEDFSGLFHQVHGYQLKLSNYGYTSLKALLDDMKDLVELQNVNGQQLIKYRHPPEHNVISPDTDVSFQEEFPNLLQTFSSLWTPFQPPAVNSTANHNLCSQEPAHSICANAATGNSLNTTQKPASLNTSTILQPVHLNNLLFSEDKITYALKEFPLGLKVDKFRKLIISTHGVDLQEYGKEWGYTDMQSLLKQIPGIVFIKENVVIASAYCDAGKPIPLQPKQARFSEKTIADFLKNYPSGLKVAKLSQFIRSTYKTDLHLYSQTMGYANILTMLQKIPGVTVGKDDVVFASDFYKKCKSHLVQPPKNVQQAANNQAKKKIVNVVKNSDPSTSTGHFSTSKLSTVTKNAANLSTSSRTNTANASRPGPASGANVPSSNISKRNYAATTINGGITAAPFATSVTSQNVILQPVHQIPQTIQPGISYAAALAGNQRRNQLNQNAHQQPVNINLHRAPDPAVTQPKIKAEPRNQFSSSIIRENLQNLLKSYVHGLSIFQLQKLYLLKFQQPLVRKGLPVKQLLMEMRDLAKVQGVGVQMQVFPAFTATSTEISTCSDFMPQRTPLMLKDGRRKLELQAVSPGTCAEHIQQGTPVTLTFCSSHSGHQDTKPAGSHMPGSSSGDNTHMQALSHNQQFIQTHVQNDIHGKNSTYPTSKTSTLFPSNKNMIEPPYHSGAGQSISQAEWPALPQKFTILKEIKESAVSSRQSHVNKQDDKLGLKQETAQSPQLQGQDATAVTSHLQPCHDFPKTNGRSVHVQDMTPALNYIGPMPHLDFIFVREDTGFSFVPRETNVDMGKKFNEMIKTDSPSPSQQEAPSSKPIYAGKTVSATAPSQQDMAKSQMANRCEPTGSSGLQLPYIVFNSQAKNQMETQCSLTEKRPSELLARKHESQVPPSGMQKNEAVQPPANMKALSTSSTSQLKQEKMDFMPTSGQTIPPKQKKSKSQMGNRCEITGSPELQLPNKVSNSQAKNQMETQCSHTEKRTLESLARKHESQVTSSGMQKNEVVQPSADTKGLSTSSTSHLQQKKTDFMTTSGQTAPQKKKKSKPQMGNRCEMTECPELQLPNKVSNSKAKKQMESQCSHTEKKPLGSLAAKSEGQVSPSGMQTNEVVLSSAKTKALSTSSTPHLLQKKTDFIPTSGQTAPPKQKKSKSQMGNRCEPAASSGLPLPNKESNSQVRNQIETPCSHTEKRPSDSLARKHESQVPPSGMQKNEVVQPSAKTKGLSTSSTSHLQQNTPDFMPTSGQITPPKQEISKSQIGNRSEITGSPELQLPNKVSNSQVKNQMETQCSHTEKRPSESLAAKSEGQVSPSGMQANKIVQSSAKMKGSSTSHFLQNKTTSGQTTPPKQEISMSQIGNRCEPDGSPELQLPNKESNFQTKNQMETHCSHTETSPSEALGKKHESQAPPSGMQKNETVQPSPKIKGLSSTPHLQQKKTDVMPTSGQTTPPKQVISKAQIGIRYEPAGSPELQFPNKEANSQARNQMETPCSHTEKRPSEGLSIRPESQLFLPRRQTNEVVHPDLSTFFITHSPWKKTDFMPTSGQMGTDVPKTVQHLETRVGETRSPSPPVQQNINTSHIFKNEMMNSSLQTQLSIPHIYTSTTAELNRSLPGSQQWHYYTARTLHESEERLNWKTNQVLDLHSTTFEEDDQQDFHLLL
ncbi:uncharacterized protein [Hyperolius riggenbachi]|uniref:uncharacterized protein isoform X2 n=1 Tax=Hyperolius riggenbachi TaxID=752182 RepID=UPI0035A31CCD